MTVLRIVADLPAQNPGQLAAFYEQLFDMRPLMNGGFIVTLGAGAEQGVQLSLASEGGSGVPVPAISVEVTDVDAVHAKAQAMSAEITYPLTDEPWGVRRFFLRDLAGHVVNVLSHR